MYLNKADEKETDNVKEMLKHGNKANAKGRDQHFTPFNKRQPFGGEVIETSKEGNSESAQDPGR